MCIADYLNDVTSSKAIWIKTTGEKQEVNVEKLQTNTFIVIFKIGANNKPCRLDIKNNDVIEYDNVKYRILAHKDDENSCTLTVENIELISQSSQNVVNNVNNNIFNVSGRENKINATQGNNSTNTVNINQESPNSLWEKLWKWIKDCPLFS